MRLILTDEQKELAGSVRGFLAGTSPMARVREIAESDTPYDRVVWERMAGELGLTGLAIPEAHGGSGFGQAELAVVMEELGAALTPSPFFASAVLAAGALLRLGDEHAAKDLLPGIASGQSIATLALPGEAAVRATAAGDGHTLDGTVARVLHAMDADLILVPAAVGGAAPGALGVFQVAPDAPGLTRTALATLDLTTPQARLELAGTPARLIGPADAGEALARTLDLASVALAAEQLGGLRRCLDTIVEYAKLRVQFGRYIGSFQGVKHRLADMHCTLEQAESIVRYAAWTADEAPRELPVAAALAQSYLGPAYFQVAKDHLLLHGGIGFTWEHDAHLYYKRAKSAELLLGPPRLHRGLLADRLGLTG
ncbi:acyl-CoA dehydrogenase family protein [Actinomadura scrupuli]|uniref:acyl-CoA dehydrogenase family protein n=1 Tax=Actinomadura scrupuli TaxID=559629 RepID=UPI003D996E08